MLGVSEIRSTGVEPFPCTQDTLWLPILGSFHGPMEGRGQVQPDAPGPLFPQSLPSIIPYPFLTLLWLPSFPS